jgi:hypothetical protein
MNRISALRNVEDALADFEAGDIPLSELEARVRGVLRTYATDFDGDLAAYRASGESSADGLVVLAPDHRTARERVRDHAGDVHFEVERLE